MARLDVTPPHELLDVGGPPETIRPIGDLYLGVFKDPGGLRPDDRVLDVGSGIGRMALPLTGYISERGSYDGFDIVRNAVRWCHEHITPERPNFRFKHADVANTRYNPGGGFRAATYTFPYEAEAFDFVFLTSVFTHLLPLSFLRYLSESARVLRPGGTLFATAFLINEESQRLIDTGVSKKNKFAHEYGECRVARLDVPEAVVAYDEGLVTDLYEHMGLDITGIYYGDWCGRSENLAGQDVIVASKH